MLHFQFNTSFCGGCFYRIIIILLRDCYRFMTYLLTIHQSHSPKTKEKDGKKSILHSVGGWHDVTTSTHSRCSRHLHNKWSLQWISEQYDLNFFKALKFIVEARIAGDGYLSVERWLLHIASLSSPTQPRQWLMQCEHHYSKTSPGADPTLTEGPWGVLEFRLA